MIQSYFYYCLFEVVMNTTVVNFVNLLLPWLLRKVVFWQQENRFGAATSELLFLVKLILTETFEVAYFATYLPIKFLKSTFVTEAEIYIEKSEVLCSTLFCFAILLVTKAAWNHQRRAQEMHF